MDLGTAGEVVPAGRWEWALAKASRPQVSLSKKARAVQRSTSG